MFRPLIQRVLAPRALFTRNRNAPVGEPGDAETQRKVLREAFQLLVDGQVPGEVRDFSEMTEEAAPSR